MTQDLQSKLVAHYQQRKMWYGDQDFQEMAEVFEIETARAAPGKGGRLLEIGFGQGLFLDWARQAGYEILGVDINPDFCRLAKERGHTVLLGQAWEVLEDTSNPFDAVFLFDVLEHLSPEEIFTLFQFLKAVLAEKGRILARVPNGASPFGRCFQHGDATHKTVLTASKLQDIAQVSGLVVEGAYNGARSLRSGSRKHPVLKRIAYWVRDLVQMALGYIYFGENLPMDPQLTVVIGHAGLETRSSGSHKA